MSANEPTSPPKPPRTVEAQTYWLLMEIKVVLTEIRDALRAPTGDKDVVRMRPRKP